MIFHAGVARTTTLRVPPTGRSLASEDIEIVTVADSGFPDPSLPPPTHAVLASALASWRRTGRVAEALPQLVAAAIDASQAERGFLFTCGDEGSYRVRLARNADGEPLVDATRGISHFVVQRGRTSDGPIHFEDTRSDRRFRTEGERDAGAKTRAIAIVPLRVADDDLFLYLDARFRGIVWNATTLATLEPIFDLLSVLLEVEATEQSIRAVERKYERRLERLERAAKPSEPAVRRPMVRTSAHVEREVDFHGFRTRNPGLIESVAELEKLAPSMLSILVEGESGTGKEVMARAIHAASGRSGRFVSLHCGALPETLVEIELYGHDRGAFTGADRARTGLLELARGGTLFLDDIGEMSDELQNGLLRVLESSTYRPVSGSEERTVDVRVLSSSLIGNEGEHTTTSLRHDLFFRLAGARFHIPPLRARGEDIPFLGRIFYDRFRGSDDPEWIAPELEAALLSYHWPGNSRELENFFQRMVALGVEEFTLDRFAEVTGFTPAEAPLDRSETHMKSVVDRAEREVILRTLRECNGNKSQAAKKLGLSRKTLYRRMSKHEIPL